MRKRARIAFLLCAPALVAASILASCGLDVTGVGPTADGAAPDTLVPEAHLPPVEDAETDAGIDGDAGPPKGCPNGRGPAMVVVDGGFCIDVTEVTNAQYDTFLAATDGGSVEAGIPKAWPSSFCATQQKTFARGGSKDSGPPGFPVALVSWCDAFAFCDWAGKRLCGGVSPTRDAGSGEWYQACSGFGATTYGYGNVYDASACNSDSPGTALPGSHPHCEAGVGEGIVDLVGNVFEHIDSCTPARDACYAVGGDFAYKANATCSVALQSTPTVVDTALGFRCCSDLTP
jgi:formylglycine-generating enzyme required for sulfatase activity